MTSATGWDFDLKTGDGGGSGINYTKFPQGVTHIRVLDDAPHMRWTHWMDQFSRSVECSGRGCPICEIRNRQKANKQEQTYGMGRRFSMNIYNHGTGRAEVMEEGITFMEDLRDVMEDLKEDGKKLSDVVLRVRKRGERRDTSYRIDVDKEEVFTQEEQDAFDNRIDFSEHFKPSTHEMILKLIQVEESTPEKYLERFIEIVTGDDEPSESDEKIETE